MIHVFGDSIAFGHELYDCPHNSIIGEHPTHLVTSSKFSWPALIGAKNWSNPGCSNEYIFRCLTILVTKLIEKEPVDKIFIQWTFPERMELPALWDEEIISTTGHWIQGRKDKSIRSIHYWFNLFPTMFSPKNKEEHDYIQWIDNYYKVIYTDNLGLIRFLEYIVWCQNLLSNLNIEYYMMLPTKNIIEGLFDKKYSKLKESYDTKMAPMGSFYNDDIIHLRESIDWDKFICYNNEEPFYSILDRARETGDIGPEGHPLEETHQEVADELRRRIL